MNSLVGLHHYRNQKRRQSRLRTQRDGLTNHGHTWDNMARREINDALDRLREIQENRKQIKWKHEGPPGKKKFVSTLRKAKFNRYEENSNATERLLLRGPSRPLIAMAEKSHRQLQGKKIYPSLQEWGYIADAIEFGEDTETEGEPQSEPDYETANNTQFQEKTTLCRDCCQGGWQCICVDIFTDEEYGGIEKNHND